MQPHPVNAALWACLQRLRRMEQRLLEAGVPRVLTRLPFWWFSMRYCYSLCGRIGRIQRISNRIHAWYDTMQRACEREGAETELIDIGQGIRDNIEGTKRMIADLRDISLDLSRLFGSVGYLPARVERLQNAMVALLSQAYDKASALQALLAEHDQKALALLRSLHDAEMAAARA